MRKNNPMLALMLEKQPDDLIGLYDLIVLTWTMES
jgi:hypothetical protein